MLAVESALKVEILNAIRAVESAKTQDEARKCGKRYGSAVRRVHAAGYEIVTISFGDKREPVDVRLKHRPTRAGARGVCAV
jgi:hypothetical protein